MTYTPDEPRHSEVIRQVAELTSIGTTPIVVPARLALEIYDHLSRLGSDRLAAELAECQPLFEIKKPVSGNYEGLGDK